MSGAPPAAPPGTLHLVARVRRTGFALDVDVAVGPGRTVAVVGPNGAGKTTLLRLVAGLPVAGEGTVALTVGGRRLDHLRPDERGVGVAFQDLRLFPHLDVLDNVAFPLRARGRRRGEARAAAAAALAEVGSDPVLHDRRPSALSGGEAQRVALARALVAEPDVLCLDEPFAAVDPEARGPARAALAARLRAFPGIALVVTHDPADALVLGDDVLVLEAGRVTQHASPAEVAARPRSPFAAGLVGTTLLPAEPAVGTDRDGTHAYRTPAGTVVVAADPAPADPATCRVGLLVAPAAVALHPAPPVGSARNAWAAEVEAVEALGGRARVRIALDGGGPAGRDVLVAEVTLAAVRDLALAAGCRVWASVKATEVGVVDRGVDRPVGGGTGIGDP